MLSQAQIQQFKIDGYLKLPKLLGDVTRSKLLDLSKRQLAQRLEPYELEAKVQYPGAPASEQSTGGDTIRRLLNAYERDDLFRQCAHIPLVVEGIQSILKSKNLYLNPNHHNCVMTKQPEFSSETAWHRDTRYWRFSDKYLINAWFALGDELEPNGALKILPGSHRWEVEEDALDDAQFLIKDHPSNSIRLDTARTIELEKGDAVLFSAHCFHAAGRNQTDQTKFSLVFTYHGESTKAIANTKSSREPALPII
jgi:phytanoyl-CoA hydroxylase